MDADLLSLLGPAPCWTQQPTAKQTVSAHASRVSDSDEVSQPEDSGNLLDRWLADQRFRGSDRRPSARSHNGSSARNCTASKALEGNEASGEMEAAVNSFDKPEKKQEHTSPLFSHADKSPQTDLSVSSSAGWKLQLFKAAVGIRKKHEEFEAQRRRSLLAFVRQAAQQSGELAPSEAVVPPQSGVNENERSTPCRGSASQKSTTTAASYTWQDGGGGKPVLISSARKGRGSILTAASIDCLQQKKEKLLKRIVLLQRKQLLAAHQLRRLPSKLEVVSLLGEGASAKVWKVRHRESGEEFALKVIKKTEAHANNSSCARVYAERHLLVRSGVSRHLAKLHAAFQDSHHLFLLQELLPGPSLFSIIQTKGRLTEVESRRFAAQLVLAVHAVHKLGFIHRDVKPENILLDKDGNVKLIDLGLAAKPAFSKSQGRMQKEVQETSQSDPCREEQPSPSRFPCMHACINACTSPSSPACLHAFSSAAHSAGVNVSPEAPTEATELHAREYHKHPPLACEQLIESFASWRLRHLSERGARSTVGTLQYMAPEVAFQRACSGKNQSPKEISFPISPANASVSSKEGFYSKKADWWSVGAVIFECLFGHSPFGRFHFSPPQKADAGKSPQKNTVGVHLEGADDEKSNKCKEAARSDLFFEPVGNPELLACMLRQWQKHLKIPPPPFTTIESKDDGDKEKDAAGASLSHRISREAVDLLQHLLCEEKERFGFSLIKCHSWFEGFDWNEAQILKNKDFFSPETKNSNNNLHKKSDDTKGGRRASYSRVGPPQTRRRPHTAFAGGERSGEVVFVAGEEGSDTTMRWEDTCAFISSDTTCQTGSNKHLYLLSGGAAPPAEYQQKGERGGGKEGREAPCQLRGNERVISSSSDTSPACTEASSPSAEEESCSLQTPRGEQKWGGLEKGKEETNYSAHARCSWSSEKKQPPKENKWLLDLRFLGFEFDRRQVHARETARRLRAACGKPQSPKRITSCEK